MQNRGVQVVHVNLVLHRAEAELVRLPESHAAAHAPSGQPGAETVRVVTAPEAVRIARAVLQILIVRRAPELARPDQQRFVEQPARLEIVDQRRDRLVHRAAAAGCALRMLAWLSQPFEVI